MKLTRHNITLLAQGARFGSLIHMERFHYCFATDFLGSVPEYKFANKDLDKAAAGFYQNLLRIQSLGRLPIILTGATIMTQTCDMWARSELGIKDEDPSMMRGHPLFNPDLYERKEAIRKDMQMAWFERMQAKKVVSGMKMGEIALGSMVPAGGDELEEGIDATLSAMVTGMWTAFEVLAETVWCATDAARPALKQALKGQKQIGHRSTLGIRRRYRLTFAVDATDILNIVDDSKIEALALIRNIIVHLGGKRDAEFNTRGTTVPELCYFLKPNAPEKIKLTGPVVLNLIKPIPTMGLNLAIYVDKWLLSHP